MANLKKILIVPIWHNWYAAAHAEYLIRYLSDEFFMEIAMPQEAPGSPFQRNPDDYDLIYLMWPGHWFMDYEKYKHKTVTTLYCPNEGQFRGCAAIGATTPITEDSLKKEGLPYHSLRFGVDTDLFKPIKMRRPDDLFHVGYIGNHANVRHLVGPVISKLTNIPGVKIDLYPTSWVNNGGTWTDWEGEKMVKHVVTGDKLWPGIPNIYNRMDVLIRTDMDPAYSFPTEEVAACGVPVIATDTGIDHLFAEAGATILIEGGREFYMNHLNQVTKQFKKAIIELRDSPFKRKLMGSFGRIEVLKHWTWEQHIDSWREFFREGLRNAQK